MNFIPPLKHTQTHTHTPHRREQDMTSAASLTVPLIEAVCSAFVQNVSNTGRNKHTHHACSPFYLLVNPLGVEKM